MLPKTIRDAVVIYNPASGRRRRQRLTDLEQASKILRAAGIVAQLASTTARGAATTLARQAVQEGRELVIACGGDGTINEVVNGLAGSQIPLAVLPAGTANILAKEIGIPWSIPAAARLISGGTLRRIALGEVRSVKAGTEATAGRYFLCVGGAGPDGAVVGALTEDVKSQAGILAYWFEGVRQFFTYRFSTFRITSPERRLIATLLVTGRTQHYGGPFRITRGASLFEDTFELVAFTGQNRFRLLSCLPAIWRNRLARVRGIEIWKSSEILCEPLEGREILAQVDGEPAGNLPLKFQIVPNALTLVLPAGGEKLGR